MELSYDWRCFQSVFRSAPRDPLVPGTSSGPVQVVVEDQKILAAFAENEDFSEWIGQGFTQLASEIPHRELIVFKRDEVDHWLKESLSQSHYYDQTEFLRKSAIPQTLARGRFKKNAKSPVLKQGARIHVEKHFALEALQGWWLKLMPASFGFFLRLEGRLGSQSQQEIFVLIRRGNIVLFCEPDLSYLGTERRKIPALVVKYLSEKYSVPVQGFFVPDEKWGEWSVSGNPWKQVFSSLRAQQSKMVPFRWGVATLIAARGIFGL
jgi:hypothetical protein